MAFAGVWLGHYYQNAYFDGIATIIIGLILTAISIVLARESYSLLMSETPSPEVLKDVMRMAEYEKEIIQVNDPLFMCLGPEEIMLVVHANFVDDLTTQQINSTIERIKKRIEQRYSYFKKIFIQPY